MHAYYPVPTHHVQGPATVHAVPRVLHYAFCAFLFRGDVGLFKIAFRKMILRIFHWEVSGVKL